MRHGACRIQQAGWPQELGGNPARLCVPPRRREETVLGHFGKATGPLARSRRIALTAPAAVMGAVLHEIVSPDMVGSLGSQSDAGAVSQPEPLFLRLRGGHLEALSSPEPLHPLGAH